MTEETTHKLDALFAGLEGMHEVVVAFSGGVDSSLVLKAAHQVLGDQAHGVLAISPSLPQEERTAAQQLAAQIGVRLELIETQETEDPSYVANAPNRCFFCKDHVYAALRAYANHHLIEHVLDGMNAEDTLDIRPGRAAAMKHEVRSPLHELGFSKQDVRDAALHLGLPTWDKPAAACLASRIPYGTLVTHELLQRIENAEIYVRSLGFPELRVRHHGDIARVEVPVDSFDAVMQKHEELSGGLKALGWLYVTLDLDGLRHGSMNAGLRAASASSSSS